MRNKRILLFVVKWLWMLAALVWVAYDYRFALGYLVVWAIGKIIVDRVIKQLISRRLKISKMKRQADAEHFLG